MKSLRDLHLEPFSSMVARALIAEFPEWEQFLGKQSVECAGLTVHVLCLRVPCPNPSVPESLEISVDLDQIIWARWFQGTDGRYWSTDWVSYFQTKHSDLNDEGLKRIAAWFQAFTNEELVAFCTIENERVDTTGFGTPADVPQRQDRETVVRSWRGTYDRGSGSVG